jgi:hypothetical protein
VVPVWDSGMRLLRYSLRLSREELSLCLTGIPGVAEFISQFVDPAVCPTREAPQWWWALRYGGETSQCSSYRLARHTRRCTSRVGGRTVVSLKLFAESVKMILSRAFCFVQQHCERRSDIAFRREDLNAHAFGTGSSSFLPRLFAQARACSIGTKRLALT